MLIGPLVTATNAADAFRAALVADVMVCDLTSAEMAGQEFLAQLQQLHARVGQTVPVIAIVPPGTRSARVRAAGFHSFLIKPVDADELRTAVLARLSE